MVDRSSTERQRELIERAFQAGLDRVRPDEAVRRYLERDGDVLIIDGQRVPVTGRFLVVAIGKAATPMACAANEVAGTAIDRGIILTKEGHVSDPPEGFDVFEASHPVPDQRGIDATREILSVIDELGANDIVLALISGGGSALFEAPAGELTLDDIQRTTSVLLRAGAPIQDLNAVRSELSQVKGGGFRRKIGDAAVVSLILSDVLGNPPEIIASGPTVPRASDPDAGLSVLDRYGVRDAVPYAVRHHLETAVGVEEPAPRSKHDLYRIVGDNEAFVAAVGSALTEEGFTVERVWREQEGEARDCAREWVDLLSNAEVDVILGGGEMTVTVTGDGAGGRNTEFALAAAMELNAHSVSGTVASLASDGQDGAIDAAGAIVDGDTIDRLRDAGIDVEASMADSDSGGALQSIGALVTPGPTGTNVNDVYIGLRSAAPRS